MIIDPKSNTPIYRQIVEQIRDAIDAGVYRADEALPSLRALAVDIRVNPNTVQRAYDELEREGAVHSRRGVGVFVFDRKSKAARGKIERNIVLGLKKCVSTGLNAEVSPARIRELFESALDASLTKARSRQ
jgi:GntR family transcriptional regulator